MFSQPFGKSLPQFRFICFVLGHWSAIITFAHATHISFSRIEEISSKPQLHDLDRLEYSSNDQGVTTYKFKTLKSFNQANNRQYLLAHSSRFVLEDEGETLYFDPNENKWFLQRIPEMASEKSDKRIPLTWCFDMSDAAEGTINQAFEILVTGDQLFGNEAKVQNFMEPTGTILLGNLAISLAESITFRGSHSCNVGRGQFARLYLKPHYFEIPEGLRVAMIPNDSGQLVQDGEWLRTPRYSMMSLGPPVLECALGRNRSICEMGLL